MIEQLSEKLGFKVLYVDDDIIAVNKPEWLLSVPGRGEDKQDSVYTRVLSEFKSARVVHRLDWATSGVMVLALHLEAQRELNRQFSARTTKKRYVAVVHGDASNIQTEIDLPLRCDWENRPRQMVDHEQGKPSKTLVEVVSVEEAEVGKRTRLSLTPITGRSHQLRVHLMAVGHPIVGDGLYSENGKSAARMLLHAEMLEITHPMHTVGTVDVVKVFSSACPF